MSLAAPTTGIQRAGYNPHSGRWQCMPTYHKAVLSRPALRVLSYFGSVPSMELRDRSTPSCIAPLTWSAPCCTALCARLPSSFACP